jgi:putative OmpL-like beta-barrel porin-2
LTGAPFGATPSPMPRRLAVAAVAAIVALAVVLAAAPVAAADKPKPLDVREPPFSQFDSTWLNGNNPQPASLLGLGPITFGLYVDSYYAYQFHAPIDHTIFPTTVAPRHDEISFNLGVFGIELTGLDGPIGRIFLQYGSNVETVAGQDPTVQRGYFLATVLKYIEQAAVGWHFHVLHGINAEAGIFPSYIGLESYLPQENWNYTHAMMSDATPYYFSGVRIQIFPTQRLKVELWLVNGWQTFGMWHEAPSGGYLLLWRPREALQLVHSLYLGENTEGKPDTFRVYTDNNAQLRYHHGKRVRSLAFALVADGGFEHNANAPDGWFGGLNLAHRAQWTSWLATTVRGDVYYDRLATVIPHLPLTNPYMLPSGGPYVIGGITITQDFLPSPWVLFRIEYVHRESNQLYFSGHNGITGPSGLQGPFIPTFTPALEKRDDRLMLNATLRL